jgi:hypothetical protein
MAGVGTGFVALDGFAPEAGAGDAGRFGAPANPERLGLTDVGFECAVAGPEDAPAGAASTLVFEPELVGVAVAVEGFAGVEAIGCGVVGRLRAGCPLGKAACCVGCCGLGGAFTPAWAGCPGGKDCTACVGWAVAAGFAAGAGLAGAGCCVTGRVGCV